MKKYYIILSIVIVIILSASTFLWFSGQNTKNNIKLTPNKTIQTTTPTTPQNNIQDAGKISPQKASNKLCFWKAGICRAIISDGYYFDIISGECKYWPPNKSGCTDPPFDSLEKCNDTCLSNDIVIQPETSPDTPCLFDDDCWCQRFDGHNFLEGRIKSVCCQEISGNRCPKLGYCQKCFYR